MKNTMHIMTFNDIDKIYANGIEQNDNEFICSVCRKKYKSLKLVNKHFEKRSCHTIKQVFEGTITEDYLYELGNYTYTAFLTIGKKAGKNRSLTKKKFLSNKSLYNFIGNLYLFSLNNSLPDAKDYLSFVIIKNCTNWKYLNMIYKVALSEKTLMSYYENRRETIYDADSEKFLERNFHNLKTNPSFFMRALERGDIGTGYFLSHIDYDSFIKSLSKVEVERLSYYVLKHQKYESI